MGDAGAARLALLDKVYGPDCHRILSQLGVSAGMRVADLGCGTGSTTAWFANIVQQRGEVCAVDFSPEQLGIAEQRSKADELRNIKFIQASADATGLPRGTFDIVHCRLLLCHVTDPLAVIREMSALAKPGGLVVAFDMDINGIYSFPETACYARLRDMIREAGKARGRDYEIAMKLPIMFRNAGLTCANLALIHPIYLRGDEKRLWENTLFEARPVLEQFGIASASELNRLADDFAAVASADTCAVAQAPLAACWAHKS
jgi:SAM-dependent methyltransferase